MKLLAQYTAFLLLIVLCGCKTAPERVVYNVTGTVIVGVEAATKTWLRYEETGKATADQKAAVAQAYDQYYKSLVTYRAGMLAWKDAGAKGEPPTIAGLQAAQAAVIQIIIQFLPAERAANIGE